MVKLLLLTFLLSCSSSIPEVKEIKIKENIQIRYCFRVEGKYKNKSQKYEICADKMGACQSAAGLTKKYGRLAGLKKVDGCRRKSIKK